VTTAELGLITTMVVGVAAAGAPTLTSWASRKHERSLLRSQRLYEQRRDTYKDIAAILERTRMDIERHSTDRLWP
jgi:uncharacterized membrane protein